MAEPALSKAKWLENRRKFLGASDMAAVMGRSQYRSQIDVYLEKVEGKVDDENDYMRRGLELEPLVIYLYQQATGHDMIPAKFLVSKKYPWAAATLDIGDKTLACPVQCKTSSTYGRDKYGDPARGDLTIPADHMIQVHHEMIVSETKVNQLAVLFAPEDGFDALRAMMKLQMPMEVIAQQVEKLYEFLIFQIPLDKTLAADIIKTGKAFWFDNVLAQVPPICDALPQKTDIIREATKKERTVLARARKAYHGWKLHEGRWEECKEELKNAIGENSGIVGPLQGKVTWKAPASKTVVETIIDWEAIARAIYISYKVPDKKWNKLVETNTTKTTTTKQGTRVVRVPSREWKKG